MTWVEELRWRGMLQDIMPGTEALLEKEMVCAYIGFDPTADSLHIGSLVPILLLVHLQRYGHKPIALVGGATGMVGDPSGKSEERNLLSPEVLRHNQDSVKKQLERFLDFSPQRPNAAEMVNNYDWFRDLGFLEFIRETGKHITVNYMLAKDSVRKRMDGGTGMSFTEFSYQLVQGYDFYYLFTQKNCKLQMGGSDQWGNIVTGTELIRRKTGSEAYALTCPLVTRSDGGKFGKTEQGNIWLDPARTSPYQFYQFWLNSSDEDAEKWIRIFTFLGKQEIESLIQRHRQDPQFRILQKTLAQEVTRFIHGEEEFLKAVRTTEKLFTGDKGGAQDLSIGDLESIEGIRHIGIPRSYLDEGMELLDLLSRTGVFPSRGEARKMILNGGLSLNREKVTQPGLILKSDSLLHGQYLLLLKGKKHYFLFKFE